MMTLFEWLSEHWLRIAEKINGAIFSFVFFWGTLPFIYHLETKTYDFFGHMEHVTGNHDYFALQIVVFLVSCVVDFVWAFMPIFVSSGIYYWNKV